MTDRELQIPESRFDSQIKQRSWIISIAFHVGVFLLFAFITCSPTIGPEELTEITWGGSGGVPGVNAPEGLAPKGKPDASPQESQPQPQQTATKQPQQSAPETPRNPNNPALETSQQTTTKETQTSNTEPTSSKKENTSSPNKEDGQQGNPEGTGKTPAGGSGGKTVGSYYVDGFGSRGWVKEPRAPQEKIYGEGTVVLSFTVLPSGAVVGVRPIKNASPELTKLAMNALKRAEARPLPSNADQVSQTFTITYTFRLQ